MYGRNGTKIMVYNMKMWQKKRGIEKHIEKRLRNTTRKEELQILDYTIWAMPRTFLYHILTTILPNHPLSLLPL